MAQKPEPTRVEFLDKILKPHLLKEPLKKAIGKDLHALGDYHDGIPLYDLRAVLKKHGLVLLQEDQTEFCGLFCGREGKALIEVGFEYTKYKGYGDIDTFKPVKNSALAITWYQMSSQRVEVISYMS